MVSKQKYIVISAITLCPVILAGGEGNRLWPLSRRHYPKQLIRLFGERSLLQETLLRCAGITADLRVVPPRNTSAPTGISGTAVFSCCGRPYGWR